MRFSFLVPCALAFVLCAGVQAAEGGGDKKPDAPKEAPKEETLKGMLSNADVEAAIATLKVRSEEKEKAEPKKYQLYATGEVANELKELLKKKAYVEVTGEIAKDGVSVKVNKVKAIEKKGAHH